MTNAALRTCVVVLVLSGAIAAGQQSAQAEPDPRPFIFAGDMADHRTDLHRVANTAENFAVSQVGKWRVEEIRGGSVANGLESVLDIAADGTVSGNGGCNGIRGSVEIAKDTIAFGPIASTRMACNKSVMDQEGRFLAALAEARTWSADPATQTLTLSNEDGTPVLVLARM